jgi:hypothetical protein
MTMTKEELNNKWQTIAEHSATGYQSLRISSECISDLFIGVNKDGNRCLILALPNTLRLQLLGIRKENLSIEYFSEKHVIVLQLTEPEYEDLFDDLVISMYHGIKDIREPDAYSRFFIETFHRWSDFFDDKSSDLLGEESIRGLMGELLVLKALILEFSPLKINAVLDFWKGPFGKGNDFELEDRYLEVKTKSPQAREVKIASEHQLHPTANKGLELIVISVQPDSSGLTLADLIFEIRILIAERNGDVSIFWRALRPHNLSSKNVSEYNIFRFKPVSWISYDCTDEGFPKITRTNIPPEISAVAYKLNVHSLTGFIIEQREF